MRNRSAPGADVVPILIYSDVAKAVDWLCAAFGFDERLRAPDRDGVVNHAQLTVGDGAIMVGRSRGPLEPLQARDVRQYVLVEVPDADEHCERAKRHGARNASTISVRSTSPRPIICRPTAATPRDGFRRRERRKPRLPRITGRTAAR